ncbi:MAG: hypothetical protein KJ767_00235 [Nanoarchaeota archaeon]|nr:hypothetical protein [Nanoarchaeota archaeon]
MNWLKRIFGIGSKVKKKEEQEIVEINIKNLDNWLDEKTLDLNEKIASFYPKIKQNLELVEKSLVVLSNVDLSERKVDLRVKQIVESNKEAYIGNVKSFIQHVKFPERAGYSESADFSSALIDGLGKLAKNSFRNARFTSELIGEELVMVTNNLRELRELAIEFKKAISNEKILGVLKVKENVKELEHLIKTRENFDREKSKFVLEKEELARKSLVLNEKVGMLKKSGEHKELLQLFEEEERFNQQIKNIDFEIRNLFGPLYKPMRKFLQITKEVSNKKILQDYIEDCVNALINDKEIRVVELLKEMKIYVVEGKINLREKRKKRVLKILDGISVEVLKKIFEKRISLEDSKKELKERISGIKVVKEIQEAEKRIIDINFYKKDLEKDIMKIKGKQERLSFTEMEKGIINDVKDITNQKIKLVY